MADARARARTARTLAVGTVRDAGRDRVLGLAAETSFFAMLSIPPLLLLLAAATAGVAGIVGAGVRDDMERALITALGGFLSEDATEGFVRPVVEGVFSGEARGGLVSISVVIAVWSSSRLAKVLIEGLNIAYNVGEWRSVWRRRGVAIAITLSAVLVIGVFLPFLTAGPALGSAIDGWAGTAPIMDRIWGVLYWPVSALMGVALLATLYHAAPNWQTPWRRDVPGAVLAVVLWVLAAVGLRLYVRIGFDATSLGPLAAPVVLLLWLYVTSLAVLLGAELNGEIERLWPTASSHPKVAAPAAGPAAPAAGRGARAPEPGGASRYGEDG